MKGKFNHFALTLGGLALFVAASPALAAKSVSVTVNPTTGYFEATPSTYRVPPGVKMSPVKDVSTAVVEKLPGGGISQSISSGIEITALKQSAPVGVKLRMGLNAVRGAATRCFTSLRCNLALSASASGLQALLDGVDWVMVEGSQPQKKAAYSDVYEGVPAGYVAAQSHTGVIESSGGGRVAVKYAYHIGRVPYYHFCPATMGSASLTGFKVTTSNDRICYYGGAGYNNGPALQPLTEAEIADTVNSNYSPDPSDLPWLSPGIDLSAADVELDITDPPSIKEPTKTETKKNAAGSPISVNKTDVSHDFTPKDNPSKQPSLDQKTTKDVKEYDAEGNEKGSSTTITNINAGNSPSTGEAPEMPIDCDLMPTLCEWMDWTKTGWEENQETEFEERDFFGDEVPSFSDSLQSISEGIGNSPISQAINSIQFPSSGTCPTGSITISVMGYAMPLVFESHCDIWESIRPIISAAFLALWALVAVRVFLSA